MPAGTDLIFFDNPKDWELIVNTSRNATVISPSRYAPIGAFDLGVSLNSDYVAVVAGTATEKTTWFFAGSIAQVYDFAPGGGNPVLGKIKPRAMRLTLNRLQLMETTRISVENFRLQYTPPPWFENCTIRVYKYVGDALNFVEDTLFNIGNALGIDPNSPDGKLVLALLRIEDIIDQRFQELSDKIDNLSGGDGSSGGGGSGGGGSGGSGGVSLGFTTNGGGNFDPSSQQDNVGFGFYQGFL
jgi:uncharacterized membrane protein YgcG